MSSTSVSDGDNKADCVICRQNYVIRIPERFESGPD